MSDATTTTSGPVRCPDCNRVRGDLEYAGHRGTCRYYRLRHRWTGEAHGTGKRRVVWSGTGLSAATSAAYKRFAWENQVDPGTLTLEVRDGQGWAEVPSQIQRFAETRRRAIERVKAHLARRRQS